MNDFLAFEQSEPGKCFLVLRRPAEGGAYDLGKVEVPVETLRDIVKCPEDFVDRIACFVGLYDAGIFF